MYLGYQKGKIKFYTDKKLDKVLYNIDKFVKTNDEYVLDGDEYVLYDDEYKAKELKAAKEEKYQQALQGAKDFINNGALFRYDDNNTIEATDGNIGKLTAYAMALQTGAFETVTWTSKEDNVLTLNKDEVQTILTGLGAVQADIWNNQFITYKTSIENAQSLDELKAIEIEYKNIEIPIEEPTEEPTEEQATEEPTEELSGKSTEGTSETPTESEVE
ncbi:MAG: hypothetical protein SPL73_08125 [Cyanobacteriota bacterium]|nr:hypothetical protein [Cyanobacteriota bacterium]MDY6364837.1 hypothetical protein [Cyanobacteriota bacterium]